MLHEFGFDRHSHDLVFSFSPGFFIEVLHFLAIRLHRLRTGSLHDFSLNLCVSKLFGFGPLVVVFDRRKGGSINLNRCFVHCAELFELVQCWIACEEEHRCFTFFNRKLDFEHSLLGRRRCFDGSRHRDLCLGSFHHRHFDFLLGFHTLEHESAMKEREGL